MIPVGTYLVVGEHSQYRPHDGRPEVLDILLDIANRKTCLVSVLDSVEEGTRDCDRYIVCSVSR